jgi:hypothetical protein
MNKILFISLVSLVTLFSGCSKEPDVVILTTSSDVLNVDPLNANVALTITANSGWTVKSPVSWCTLSDSIGNGNKSIVLLCADNTTGKSRETTISIQTGSLSKSVVVKQYGGLSLLEENFNDNGMSWNYVNDSISETINNGFFDIKNNCKYSAYFVGTRPMITNYTGNYMIMMDYNTISGSSPFGITFGLKDNQNFYRVLIYPQGIYSVTMRFNNVNTSILSGSSTVIKSENAISLVKIGKNCDLYINGSKIGTFDISTPYGSMIGFYSYPQTEVYVDYIKVVQY